jgi:hypothetical protein
MIDIPEGVSIDVTIYFRIDGPERPDYGLFRGEGHKGGSLVESRDRFLTKIREMVGDSFSVSPCLKEEYEANADKDDD